MATPARARARAAPASEVDDAALREKVLVVHERLCAEYRCPIAYFHELDPLSELVSSLLSHRTKNADSGRAFRQLRARFATWEAVRDAPDGRGADGDRARDVARAEGAAHPADPARHRRAARRRPLARLPGRRARARGARVARGAARRGPQDERRGAPLQPAAAPRPSRRQPPPSRGRAARPHPGQRGGGPRARDPGGAAPARTGTRSRSTTTTRCSCSTASACASSAIPPARAARCSTSAPTGQARMALGRGRTG
jgi:hypothetical protein